MVVLSWTFFFLHLISDFFGFFFFLSVADQTRKRHTWIPVGIAFSMVADLFSRISHADFFLYTVNDLAVNPRIASFFWKLGLLYYGWVICFSWKEGPHHVV